MTVLRVATVDNHEVVRSGVAARLDRESDLTVTASVASIEGLLAADADVDVVLLDLLLEEGSSSHRIPELVARGLVVLLYTTEELPVPLRRAVELGASGVLLKSDPLDTVVASIRSAAKGEFCCSGPLAHALLTDEGTVAALSPRQVEILRLLDEGLDYRATGQELGVSDGAIKTHLARIREKFRRIGVEPSNSHHLIRLAREQGDFS